MYRPLHYSRGIATCLEAFAGVAVVEGQPERAAQLFVWRRCSARGRAARHGLPTGPTMSGT